MLGTVDFQTRKIELHILRVRLCHGRVTTLLKSMTISRRKRATGHRHGRHRARPSGTWAERTHKRLSANMSTHTLVSSKVPLTIVVYCVVTATQTISLGVMVVNVHFLRGIKWLSHFSFFYLILTVNASALSLLVSNRGLSFSCMLENSSTSSSSSSSNTSSESDSLPLSITSLECTCHETRTEGQDGRKGRIPCGRNR